MIKLPKALREIFGTHGEPEAVPLEQPIFVTGCMRSGTTFLVDKMASHPQLLKIGVELNQVWTDLGGASIKERCHYKTADDASPVYTYQMARYFADFISQSQSLKRKAMRRYLKHYHGLGRASYDWSHIVPVNKSPHLMNKLGYVGALFPKSTLIVIVRDIYSHSASMKFHFDKLHRQDGRTYFMEPSPESCYSQTTNEVPFNGIGYPGDFSIIPQMWMRMNKLALKEFESAKFERKILISYEELVTNQQAVLSKLFAALDLRDIHSEVAQNIAKQATILVNTTTKGDPLKKWKKQLSPAEIEAIDTVLLQHKEDYTFVQDFVQTHQLK